MSTQVTVVNNDQKRRIEVIKITFDKDNRLPPLEGPPHPIEPGGSAIYNVDALIDLRVREEFLQNE
jgi:hypothetical protein